MIGAQGEWSRVILVRGSAVPVLGTEQVVGGLRPHWLVTWQVFRLSVPFCNGGNEKHPLPGWPGLHPGEPSTP